MVISENALLSQVQLGDLVLPNRCVMAPLTRCRAVDHLPNALMAESSCNCGTRVVQLSSVLPRLEQTWNIYRN